MLKNFERKIKRKENLTDPVKDIQILLGKS